MKSKQTLTLLAFAVATALSANAALFVGTAAGGGSASAGVSYVDNGNSTYNPGPFSIRFEVDSAVFVTSLGVFDQNADGFGNLTGGFTVSLYQNTTGNAGALISSAVVTDSSTLTGVWRMEGISTVTLVPGVTYALTVESTDIPGLGLYSSSTDDNGYSDSAINATNRDATYASGFSNISVRTRGAGDPFSFSNIFDANGSTRSGALATQIRGGTLDFTPVPEPETYALLAGAGLVGFGLWRRRASKA